MATVATYRMQRNAAHFLVLFFIKFTFALKTPSELLHDVEDVNLLKTRAYARHAAFPVATEEVDVELPLNVEESMENAMRNSNNNNINNEETELQSHDGNFNMAPNSNQQQQQQRIYPAWLQMNNEPTQEMHKHRNNNHNNNNNNNRAFIKLPQQNKHSHTHTNGPDMSPSSAAATLRRCSIEISSKIPGICQPMSQMGSACVSGEYLEVFNADCN